MTLELLGITILTDKFSTYVIVYADEAESPATGDSNKVWAYMMTAIFAAIIMAVALKKKSVAK